MLTRHFIFQITDTIASVRKVNPAKILEELNASGEQGKDQRFAFFPTIADTVDVFDT